jgi:hypothetical protein
MGLSIGSNDRSVECNCTPTSKIGVNMSARRSKACECASIDTTPEPNKFAFKVVQIEKGEYYDLITVKYQHCTTFNGHKLLLVKRGSVTKVMKELDPHFFEGGFIVGRFLPTVEGIALAKSLQSIEV